MEKLRGKWVEVQGYKHDGRMHRIWDSTYVIDETDEYVVVSSKKEIGRASCRERV